MDDGTEVEICPGDVARIEPGHDAGVVGDEPCVAVDFGPSPAYARQQLREPTGTGATDFIPIAASGRAPR